MRQKAARHFPFAALGLVLLAVSVSPTVIGMVRGFNQIQRGEDATAMTSSAAIALHPAFVACGAAGWVLIMVGIALTIRRGHYVGHERKRTSE